MNRTEWRRAEWRTRRSAPLTAEILDMLPDQRTAFIRLLLQTLLKKPNPNAGERKRISDAMRYLAEFGTELLVD